MVWGCYYVPVILLLDLVMSGVRLLICLTGPDEGALQFSESQKCATCLYDLLGWVSDKEDCLQMLVCTLAINSADRSLHCRQAMRLDQDLMDRAVKKSALKTSCKAGSYYAVLLGILLSDAPEKRDQVPPLFCLVLPLIVSACHSRAA